MEEEIKACETCKVGDVKTSLTCDCECHTNE